MFINAFSYPIISFIVDYFQLTSWFDRMMFEKQIAYYTQRDCNQLYELPDSQIPFKYAYIVRTLWLTFFFSPFVPIVALFSLLGILSYYFVCKVLFRYSYKIPNIRSNQINTSALWLTYSAPLILNLGQFLIFLFINSRVDVKLGFSVAVIVYLSLALSILWTLIPWYEINSRLFKFEQSTNETYSDNSHKFEVTYEMIDPFYDGQRTLQRDSHFLRTIMQSINSSPFTVKP